MLRSSEIVVDCFAGGGGASTGIERAIRRPVDYAVNHNAKALAVHMANHPRTVHLHENIRNLDPRTVGPGRQIGLGWFSPDCTYYSKARGGKPFRDPRKAMRIRGLATSVIWWMQQRRPRVVMLENVEEFSQWGPLLESGKPCPIRRGQSFRRWHKRIENLGYRIDMRQLVACDHGAGTSRRRLFVVARCDDEEIVFPERTHGPGRLPYVTAADCIDFTRPCPSIFNRDKPLAEATMRRIARGVWRYVINNPRPFIVPVTHHGDSRVHSVDEPLRTITTAQRGEFALVCPTLINTRNGERAGQDPRVRDSEGFPMGKLHGLRMLDPDVFSHLPLHSADSTNVARNSGIDKSWNGSYAPPTVASRAIVMMDRIESHASARRWCGSGAGVQRNMELIG